MDPRSVLGTGDIEILSGLFGGVVPKAALALSGDVSREEMKAYFLDRGISIRSETVTSVVELAALVLGVPDSRIVRDSALPESIRQVFRERKLGLYFTELNRLRRQRDFYHKCARALDSGRRAYAHDAELGVYEERLRQNEIQNPLRRELLGLAQVLEAALSDRGLWDEPTLIRAATEKLRTLSGPPPGIPETLFVVEDPARESLEIAFLEALSTLTIVSVVQLDELLPREARYPKLAWERWHSIDDACESVPKRDLKDSVVLIPDDASLRVTLKRVFRECGIPESDARDPLEPKMNEELKLALLPVRVVRSRFSRDAVTAWLRCELRPEALTDELVEKSIVEISYLGVRMGLEHYRALSEAGVFAELEALSARFPSRLTLDEFREAHERSLPPRIALRLKSLYDRWALDLALIGDKERFRRAPLAFWAMLLEERFETLRAKVPPLKIEGGLDLYRVSQARLVKGYKKAYCVGLPSDWLASVEVGDWFFTEREREALGTEFSVHSGRRESERRKARLLRWLRQVSDRFTFVDYRYGPKGDERESLGVLLPALDVVEIPDRPQERGSLPKRLQALQKWDLSAQPQSVTLTPPRLRADGAIRASEIERYSRCAFTALAAYRWKLEDLREPEPDLWADTRGNVVHRALELLLESWTDEGTFSRTAESVVHQAWKEVPLRGLERSERVIAFAKRRLIRAVEKFIEEERRYRARAQVKLRSLEEDFTLHLNGHEIRLRVDRIDEHPEGLFIIDYKTSSKNPTGANMLSLGYRLQLAIYALAARQALKRPVVGAQFIVVGTKADRTKGIFSKALNGAETGRLTQVHGSNKSLFKEELETVWEKFEAWVSQSLREYLSGRFDPLPKKKDECGGCFYPDLCGKNRLKAISDGETDA